MVNAARYTERERGSMKHANEIFPEALKQLIEIGEKARKQKKRERAGRVALPRKPGACMHAACREKQLKLQLQTRI